MEVGSTKTKRTQSRAPYAVRRNDPRPQFGVDVERRMRKVDFRIEMLAVHAGRKHFVSEGQSEFQ